MQEMEEIRRKREKIEAHQLLKAASALQKEQEQQIRARNEVASIAQAMESSGQFLWISMFLSSCYCGHIMLYTFRETPTKKTAI